MGHGPGSSRISPDEVEPLLRKVRGFKRGGMAPTCCGCVSRSASPRQLSKYSQASWACSAAPVLHTNQQRHNGVCI